MNPATVLSGLVLFAAVSGCAMVTGHPQTAEEFRQAVPGALMGKMESFEVNRPFSDVAGTFQKRAPECLHKTVKTTSQTNMSYQVIVTTYNPTVLAGADKVELHLQQHHDAGVINVTKEPDGGYYLIVADAFPISKNRTHVDIYRPSMGFDVIVRGIKGWATGEIQGCPDLTKI